MSDHKNLIKDQISDLMSKYKTENNSVDTSKPEVEPKLESLKKEDESVDVEVDTEEVILNKDEIDDPLFYEEDEEEEEVIEEDEEDEDEDESTIEEGSQEYQILHQLTELNKKLAEKDAKDAIKDDKDEEPIVVDFIKDEEQLEEITSSPEKFNAFISSIVNTVRAEGDKKVENILKKIPDMVAQMRNEQDTISNFVNTFYKQNPELKKNADYVAYTATKLLDENPELNNDLNKFSKLLKETVITNLNIKSKRKKPNSKISSTGARPDERGGDLKTKKKKPKSKETISMLRLLKHTGNLPKPKSKE